MPRPRKARQPIKPPESIADPKPSQASAARLSLYLRCLEGWRREGIAKVSSSQIAEMLGLSDAQVQRHRLSRQHRPTGNRLQGDAVGRRHT